MLIHRIAAQLYTAEALQTVETGLDAGADVPLAVSQSGRTLMAAAQFARRPRPTVYMFFSPFLHSTRSLSVSREYLALPDGPGRFAQDSSCPALLRIPLCLIWLRVQDYHLL